MTDSMTFQSPQAAAAALAPNTVATRLPSNMVMMNDTTTTAPTTTSAEQILQQILGGAHVQQAVVNAANPEAQPSFGGSISGTTTNTGMANNNMVTQSSIASTLLALQGQLQRPQASLSSNPSSSSTTLNIYARLVLMQQQQQQQGGSTIQQQQQQQLLNKGPPFSPFS